MSGGVEKALCLYIVQPLRALVVEAVGDGPGELGQ